MNQKMMIDIDAAFDAYLETLSPEQLAEFYELVAKDLDSIEDAKGVQIVKDDDVCVAPKEEIVEKVAVKKTKCRCCGFAKKAYRVNAEGICKVCYIALATSDGKAVEIVGRQGKKGHNAVSIVVGGERVKVSRKVRLDS